MSAMLSFPESQLLLHIVRMLPFLHLMNKRQVTMTEIVVCMSGKLGQADVHPSRSESTLSDTPQQRLCWATTHKRTFVHQAATVDIETFMTPVGVGGLLQTRHSPPAKTGPVAANLV